MIGVKSESIVWLVEAEKLRARTLTCHFTSEAAAACLLDRPPKPKPKPEPTMPKSKRQRVKPLTKAEKKGNDLKQSVVEAVRGAVDSYSSVYAFSFVNMRTNHFKQVRLDFPDSRSVFFATLALPFMCIWFSLFVDDCRFFLGKNKVMQVALGRSKEEEYADDLARLSRDISGNTGLLFTNQSRADVLAYFAKLAFSDYPRSGFVATETVKIEQGPLPQFIGSMVESLRGLGLPVDLKKGAIVLSRDHTICKEGQTLTPEQAKLLQHFDRKMAEFRLEMLSVWADGKYERLAADQAEDDDVDM